MREISKELPKELRTLVKHSVALLGKVIQFEVGQKSYQQIERIRKEMASIRGAPQSEVNSVLNATLSKIRRVSPQERFQMTHAFTLMLELINACENAYRTFRLQHYDLKDFSQCPTAMIYVLTAHPTEARSPANTSIFHQIQKTLTQLLIKDSPESWDALRNELELAWHISPGKTRKPKVKDEADHVYSIALREETLNALLASRQAFGPLYLRSWIGGDKDGHPGVNEKTLIMSLNLSRKRILTFFRKHLLSLIEDLKLIQAQNLNLKRAYQQVQQALVPLHTVLSHDGVKIKSLHFKLKQISKIYERSFGVLHPELLKLNLLLQMFPALVIPMELREHSALIQAGTQARSTGQATVMGKMLRQLALISQGSDPRFYVRGLIISMASSFQHIQAAATLVQRYLSGLKLPIIPLFEQKAALEKAPQILKEMLENSSFQSAIQKQWHGYFEIMLGYSDSAKELGVFASHLTIMNTVHQLDRLFKKYSIKPVFFHGSGGSTDRGGGSIEEQTEWWPQSALQIYKATIQGEMVERTFASFEITRRRFEQIVIQMNQPPRQRASLRRSREPSQAVERFAFQVSQHYQETITSPQFLKIVQEATLYRYLNLLRIGSRPAKRRKVIAISELRTIPWVLCWTQTRVLLPTWWGVGTFWSSLKRERQSQKELTILRRSFEEVPVFRSYIKILSSTLARVELPIWRLYLENSHLPSSEVKEIFSQFQSEYRNAVDFVRNLSQNQSLLWFRPWFGESIQLRSPMIHPLNLLQIVAIQQGDTSLLRESVTGIASGMMTTG